MENQRNTVEGGQKKKKKRIRRPNARFVSWVWPELVMVIIHRIMLCTCKFETRLRCYPFLSSRYAVISNPFTCAHPPLMLSIFIYILFFFLTHTRAKTHQIYMAAAATISNAQDIKAHTYTVVIVCIMNKKKNTIVVYANSLGHEHYFRFADDTAAECQTRFNWPLPKLTAWQCRPNQFLKCRIYFPLYSLIISSFFYFIFIFIILSTSTYVCIMFYLDHHGCGGFSRFR